MGITRRQFLTRTGLATAGTLFAPSLFRNPFVSRAFAETLGDRYLVVIFLDGGNDGLNTVTPWDNGAVGDLRAAYEAARGTGSGGLRLLESELSATQVDPCPSTGTPLAIHPGMASLKSLYDGGKLAVIQGCGYPDYNLSHEQSRFIWESANPTNVAGYGHGWVGRYFVQAGYGGTDIPALCVRNDVAPEFRQTTTSVLATRNLNNLNFPYDGYNDGDNAAKRAAFEALYGSAGAGAQGLLSYVGGVGNATLTATDNYPGLPNSPLGSQYQGTGGLNSGIARDLRQVARVVNAVSQGNPSIQARHFQVRTGGYDTHSDQGGAAPGTQHYNLHQRVSDAVGLFYDDCVAMGVEDKMLILVWSEFSRRIEQNDNGTDHGSQGPMFVVGGGVNGGVYGAHPDINDASLNNDGNTKYSQAAADPYRSTDFRDVYGTVLKHWLNIPPTTITNLVLPVDTIPDPDSYWTVPDFDLPFL
jgi:uncharacterized protein (DUF1501 family)